MQYYSRIFRPLILLYSVVLVFPLVAHCSGVFIDNDLFAVEVVRNHVYGHANVRLTSYHDFLKMFEVLVCEGENVELCHRLRDELAEGEWDCPADNPLPGEVREEVIVPIDLLLDVYLPKPFEGEGAMTLPPTLPVIIYVHGGGFSIGLRYDAEEEVSEADIRIEEFVRRGYIGVSINYRQLFTPNWERFIMSDRYLGEGENEWETNPIYRNGGCEGEGEPTLDYRTFLTETMESKSEKIIRFTMYNILSGILNESDYYSPWVFDCEIEGLYRFSDDFVDYFKKQVQMSATDGYNLLEWVFREDMGLKELVHDHLSESEGENESKVVNVNIDHNYVAIGGGSAGATIALLLGYGPKGEGEIDGIRYEPPVGAVYSFAGTLLGFEDELAVEIQDAEANTSTLLPSLIAFHGGNDEQVPYCSIMRLYDTLRPHYGARLFAKQSWTHDMPLNCEVCEEGGEGEHICYLISCAEGGTSLLNRYDANDGPLDPYLMSGHRYLSDALFVQLGLFELRESFAASAGGVTVYKIESTDNNQSYSIKIDSKGNALLNCKLKEDVGDTELFTYYTNNPSGFTIHEAGGGVLCHFYGDTIKFAGRIFEDIDFGAISLCVSAPESNNFYIKDHEGNCVAILLAHNYDYDEAQRFGAGSLLLAGRMFLSEHLYDYEICSPWLDICDEGEGERCGFPPELCDEYNNDPCRELVFLSSDE